MLQHLPAPLQRLRLQLRQRHHRIHQPHLQRLLRIILPAQIPNLPRLLLPHNPRQIARPQPPVKTPHLRPRLPEPGVVRRDRQIAHHMQHMPAPNRIPRHHRHHRLRQPPNLLLHIQNVQTRNPILTNVPRIPPHLLIAPRTKRQRPLPRQNDHPHLPILMHNLKRLQHLLHRLRPKRIAHLRAIDRNLRNPVLGLLQLDISVSLDRCPHNY